MSSAGGQLGNFALSGINAAPNAYNLGNSDLNSVWQNLANYSNIASGIGGMGGTQMSTGTPQGGGLGDILGSLSSIIGLGKGSGGSGQLSPVTITPPAKLPWQ